MGGAVYGPGTRLLTDCIDTPLAHKGALPLWRLDKPLLTVCELWDISTHGYRFFLCCHGYHLLLVLPWLQFSAYVSTGPDQAIFRVQRRTYQPPR